MASTPADQNLMQSIQAEIEKSLPQLHASVLKGYLVEAEANKAKVKELQDDNNSLRRERDDLRSKVDGLKRLENMETALKAQEALLAQQKAVDAIVVACEKEKTCMAERLFTTVFRNIEVRSTKMGNLPLINRNPDGSTWSTTLSTVVDETEHKE